MLNFLNSKRRRYLKEAKRLRRHGNQVRSGEYYEMAEEFDEALRMYIAGRHFVKAGQLSERMGKLKEAASYYEHAGRYTQAATLFEGLGEPQRAAQALQRGGQHFRAGLLLERCGAHGEAARCFEQAGNLFKAAKCYVAARATRPAAKLFKSILRQLADKELELDASATREFFLEAANCFERAKDFPAAAETYRSAGHYVRAAEAYLRLQMPKEAAEMFFQAEEYTKGLTLVENYGLTDFNLSEFAIAMIHGGKYLEGARIFERAGMAVAAADAYQRGGEFEKAATLYLEGGDPASAARVYRRAGMHAAAACAFVEANLVENAAQSYVEAGDKENAAKLLAQLGRHYEAGNLLLDLGQKEQALSQLQKVLPSSEHYLDASDKVGQLFLDKDLPLVALDKYRAVLNGRTLSTQTRSLYFHFAVAMEQSGHEASALPIYQKIASDDFSFRDVADRVQRLQSMSMGTITNRGFRGDSRPRMMTARGVQIDELFVGRYEILERLGGGGMGDVYKARDVELDEIIALKLLRDPDPTTIQRLKREIKITRKLAHSNIVRLFHFAEHEGIHYLSMEYVEGKTLKNLVLERGAFSSIEAVHIVAQIARALEAAHHIGVIHRDVKPHNILLTGHDLVKVLDFGIACVLNESSSLTREGEVIGTPEYMSPEQICSKPVDARSDLYSLGIVAFELVTGMVPFHADTPVTTALQHLKLRPPKPSSVYPLVPEEIDEMILKLLNKRPEERYPSARELLVDLMRL